MTPLRRLVRHFGAGLLDNDLISPGEDLHASAAGALAALLVLSASVALVFLGKYNSIIFAIVNGQFTPSRLPTLHEKVAMAVDDKTLLIGGAMALMALIVTVFWDSLALDTRDLAVLGPLPVRPADVLLAKSIAAGGAAVLLAAGLNVLPALFFPVVVFAKTDVPLSLGMRWMAAHAFAGLAGCAFVVLSIAAARAAGGTILPRRLAATVLPAVQAVLVLVALSALLAMPVLASGARPAIEGSHPTFLLFPPLWFVGLGEWAIGRTEPAFASLAARALAALTLAAGAALAAQAASYRLRTHHLQAGASSAASPFGRLLATLLRTTARLAGTDPRARAAFLFSVRTLTRNPRHRLYAAASLGVGLAVAAATGGAAWNGVQMNGRPLDLTAMVLAAQVNLVFFVVFGLRLAASVPADVQAGWVFRFHTSPARKRFLAGTRAAIFFLAILPLLAALAALHVWLWGPYAAAVQFAVGAAAALGLLEVAFARSDRLPFVTTYTPGRTLLRLRFPLYVSGYVLVVHLTPAVERLLIERTGMFFAWLALFVVLVRRLLAAQSSRLRGDDLPVFDASPGEVQLLELGPATASNPHSTDRPDGVQESPGSGLTRATRGPSPGPRRGESLPSRPAGDSCSAPSRLEGNR